jgi:serine/threonine protein kinase/Flp pilus assembly protein TadD
VSPSTLASRGLADRLAEEMAAAWQRGDRRPAEDYLEQYPELLGTPEEAVRLVYEEVCLRQEGGEEVAPLELARRFPGWADELAVLLECHRLMRSRLDQVAFPGVGESLGDFRLVAELGRGSQGRVFLATQVGLADRPVVLKVTARRAREHLCLARLQHTHIIPLHALYDFPARNLQALCMPFLGGATLDRVLDRLRGQPLSQRTGQSLVDAIAAQPDAPLTLSTGGAPSRALGRVSYVAAVCHIAACLADGLHHAHERDVVHLDLKPSNVLLAADAQPLLLDFHLALHPLTAGQAAPEGLGGTPASMAPEQERACAAARRGAPVPAAVDRRADVYALGRLLYVALGGQEKPVSGLFPPLCRCNPHAGTALSDLVGKCLAADPAERYADAASVADDLRRHLADLPLRGVRNRDLLERWSKWRRRRPNAPLWAGVLLALLAAGVLLAAGLVERGARRMEPRPAAPAEPEGANGPDLARARELLRLGQLEQAARELEHATDLHPGDFWANFYRGVCAHRGGRHAEAVQSFGVAIALAPRSAQCYYNRALAHAAGGDTVRARRDYDRALELAPELGAAALNRGVLHYQEGRFVQARADLERALRDGVAPAAAHYNLALVQLALDDQPAARRHVEQALRHDPAHAEARRLRDRLRP